MPRMCRLLVEFFNGWVEVSHYGRVVKEHYKLSSMHGRREWDHHSIFPSELVASVYTASLSDALSSRCGGRKAWSVSRCTSLYIRGSRPRKGETWSDYVDRCEKQRIKRGKQIQKAVGGSDEEVGNLIKQHLVEAGLGQAVESYGGDVMLLCRHFFPDKPSLRAVASYLFARSMK